MSGGWSAAIEDDFNSLKQTINCCTFVDVLYGFDSTEKCILYRYI